MAEQTHELMEKSCPCATARFIFQSSEIYGGLNGFWDYGPLGAELKRNVKDSGGQHDAATRRRVASKPPSSCTRNLGASGHTSTFSDPMVDCWDARNDSAQIKSNPQKGAVFHYTGARSKETGLAPGKEYSVLIRARKTRKAPANGPDNLFPKFLDKAWAAEPGHRG